LNGLKETMSILFCLVRPEFMRRRRVRRRVGVWGVYMGYAFSPHRG
jgi:hypothetical protein